MLINVDRVWWNKYIYTYSANLFKGDCIDIEGNISDIGGDIRELKGDCSRLQANVRALLALGVIDINELRNGLEYYGGLKIRSIDGETLIYCIDTRITYLTDISSIGNKEILLIKSIINNTIKYRNKIQSMLRSLPLLVVNINRNMVKIHIASGDMVGNDDGNDFNYRDRNLLLGYNILGYRDSILSIIRQMESVIEDEHMKYRLGTTTKGG